MEYGTAGEGILAKENLSRLRPEKPVLAPLHLFQLGRARTGYV